MAIIEIEIEGHGVFKVKDDMMHRNRSYLKLYEVGRFKQIQFNSFEECFMRPRFQKGYDYESNEINIKVTKET